MADNQSWPGPLFYPPVGMIAVMHSGTRIEVWDDESDDPGCFTGMNLRDGDASTFWGRQFISRVEPPRAKDSPHLSDHYSATGNHRNAVIAAVYRAFSSPPDQMPGDRNA